MILDPTDEALLNAAQGDFPIARRPFALLGAPHGIDEAEVIERFRKMRDAGLVRYFGPVIATRALGFRSTLCAFKIPSERVEEAAELVSSHPGVSHNYERDDEINLWFTLAVPPDLDLDHDFQILADRAGAKTALLLPSIKTYKIRMVLDVRESKSSPEGDAERRSGQRVRTDPRFGPKAAAEKPAEITDDEKNLLAELETGLDFTPRPFADAARTLGTNEAAIIQTLKRLVEEGPVRRIGVLLHHRRAGFQYNEMTAWIAPDNQIDRYGTALAALPNISHAYRRVTCPEWPYNLYAMFHAHSREELRQLLKKTTEKLNPATPPRRLRSLREFKKQRLRYFIDDFYTWPRD